MNRCPLILLIALVSVLPSVSFGQPVSPIASDWLMSAVNRDTAGIAQVQLSAINVDALAAELIKLVPKGDVEDLRGQLSMATGLLSQFRQAGVDHVYGVASTGQLATDNILLVPCRDNAIVGNLLQLIVDTLPPELEYKVQRSQGVAAICTDAVWKRIGDRRTNATQIDQDDEQAVVRWQANLESVQAPHWFVVSLPEPLRDELALLWRDAYRLGESDVSLGDVVKNMKSLRLTAETTNTMNVALDVINVDEPAAATVQEQLQLVTSAMPEEIDGFAVPKPLVTRMGSVVSLRWNNLMNVIAKAAELSRGAAKNTVVADSLRQIGLAIHQYADSHQHLPPRATVTPDGKELLSWRVHLLPYLGERALYERFNLSEPWDSQQNAALIPLIPESFRAGAETSPVGTTRLLFPIMPGSLWEGQGPPRKFADVTDGTSQTIAAMLAPPEAANVWTKPDNWQLKSETISNDIFRDANATWILNLDGAVLRLTRDEPASTLKARLTHASGEVIP